MVVDCSEAFEPLVTGLCKQYCFVRKNMLEMKSHQWVTDFRWERERYRRRYCLCRLVIMLFHCFGLGERWPTDNLPLMQYHNSRVHMTTGTRQLWGNMWKNQQGCGVSARYTWHVFLAGVLRLPPALMATSCNQNFDFDVEFIPMETEWEREN